MTTNGRLGSPRRGKPTSILSATEKEWKISLSTLTGAKVKFVRHGLIRFKVRNVGVLAHNFVIARHQTILITHGKRTVVDVTLKRGRYRYICSIAGHAAKGMKGVLVVT
jgi:plastocyanin